MGRRKLTRNDGLIIRGVFMKRIIISPILSILIAIQFVIPVYANWINTELGWQYRDGNNEIVTNMYIDGYEINDEGVWNNQLRSFDYLAREMIDDISEKTFDNTLYSTNIAFTDMSKVQEFNTYLKNVYYLGTTSFQLYFNSVENDSTYVIAVYLDATLAKALKEHKAAITKIDNIVTPVKDKTIEEKLFFINQWITNNTNYDESKTRHKVYDLLFAGTSVCNGYAQLFKAMCNACNIECVYILGTANNQSHAFNRVNLNGVFKYIDCAWNAQSKSLTWYMLDESQFIADHSISIVYN